MEGTRKLRLVVRALARRPGYASAAVLTLALGIGANVAIFAVVNAVLIRPLPYPSADELVTIDHHAPGVDLPELRNSEGTLHFYRQEADYLSAITVYDSESRNLVGGPQPEHVSVIQTGPELFEILRVQPFLGRPFNETDAAEGAAGTIVLTHAMWTSRFGADPSIIGRTVELDGVSTEVIGVMPRGFAFPDDDVDAYTPMYIDPQGPFGTFGLDAVARLSPGVTVEQAAQRTVDLQPRLTEYFPDMGSFMEQSGWSVTVETLRDHLVGEDVASALWIVLGTVAFVLLIACANVANLFLVRAESRQKELAVRAALGAGAARIVGDFTSEALVLGLAGGALGVALAWGSVELLVARGPEALPRLHEVGIDWAALGVAGTVSVLAALLLGALPVLRYRSFGPTGLSRDGGRGATAGRERHRARNALVASQLALALVLLVGSGLMLRSFQALRSVDPGVDPDGVLAVGLSLGGGVSGREGASFYQRVADEVAALPGVESVGLTTLVPMGEGSAAGGSFYIESRPRAEEDLPPVALWKAVGAGYLRTMRQTLVEGRALTTADWQEGAAPVVVVNQTFADQFLDGDAPGERVRWQDEDAYAEIVGVVADVHEFGLREEVRAVAYLPLVVEDWGEPSMASMYLLVRSAGEVSPSVPAIREIVNRLDPNVPLTSIRTMEEIMAGDMAEMSFTMVLLGIAAGVAVFLGAVGLFGVVSYVVGQRTREIGVRQALGARGQDIRAMVLRQGARVAAVGVAAGLLGAFALTRLMATVLFEVSSTDPVSFVAAPLLLLAVTVAATWLPARRASRVDPVEALRAE